MSLNAAAAATDCRPCAKAAAWPMPRLSNGYNEQALPLINTDDADKLRLEFFLLRDQCYQRQSSGKKKSDGDHSMNIQGKSALVTGGASGLGAATVRMLAAQGAKVAIADLNEKNGADLARELGANASFVKTDVTD